MSELLKETGISVKIAVAGDGKEALDIMNRGLDGSNATLPDLVILDLNLPRVHGFDVLLAMRSEEELRSIPVIVMTGSLNTEDEKKARSMGAIDYRIKPTSKEDFEPTTRWLKSGLTPLIYKGKGNGGSKSSIDALNVPKQFFPRELELRPSLSTCSGTLRDDDHITNNRK